MRPYGTKWSDDLPVARSANLMLTIAISIARRYPKTAPSVEALQSAFGMSRATAYRYRRAFLDATGQTPEVPLRRRQAVPVDAVQCST